MKEMFGRFARYLKRVRIKRGTGMAERNDGTEWQKRNGDKTGNGGSGMGIKRGMGITTRTMCEKINSLGVCIVLSVPD